MTMHQLILTIVCLVLATVVIVEVTKAIADLLATRANEEARELKRQVAALTHRLDDFQELTERRHVLRIDSAKAAYAYNTQREAQIDETLRKHGTRLMNLEQDGSILAALDSVTHALRKVEDSAAKTVAAHASRIESLELVTGTRAMNATVKSSRPRKARSIQAGIESPTP